MLDLIQNATAYYGFTADVLWYTCVFIVGASFITLAAMLGAK